MVQLTHRRDDIEVVTWSGALDGRIRAIWEQLVACNPEAPLFCYPEWNEFGSKAGLVKPGRLLIIRHNGQPIGLFPLQRRTPWTAGITVPLAQDYSPILLDPALRAQAWAIFWDWFYRQSGLKLTLLGRYQDEQQLAQLQQAAEEVGVYSYLRQVNSRALLALPENWDAFLAGLPPKRRYTVRHTEDLLQQQYPDATTELLTDVAQCLDATERLMQLSCRQFQGTDNRSAFHNRNTRNFYREAMRWAVERGYAALHVLRAGDTDIALATSMHIPHQQIAYYHQVGRNIDALPNAVSPGLLVLCQVARWAIARGARVLDLGHLMPYKAAIGGQEIKQWELFAAPSPQTAAVFSKIDIALQMLLYCRRYHLASLVTKKVKDALHMSG